MTPRNIIRWLLVLALGLPLLQSLLVWVAGLLTAMGDQAAALALARINVAAGVVWLASLVGLVIVLALDSLASPSRRDVDDDGR